MKINLKTRLSHLICLVFLTVGFNCVAIEIVALGKNDKLNIVSCHTNGIKEQVKCGTLLTPENYQQPDGEKISINFIILPAIDNSEKRQPLMFLAGGPGQSATELAAHIDNAFWEIRKTRDIILIDQRGTGKSHPLECDENGLDSNENVYTITQAKFDIKEVKACLAEFAGDLSQYDSENSIRDFDAVRTALNHQQINLYGGSYGTRAALVYMRLFPASLRAVVLDSVAPIEIPIGPFGQSSARSFNLLLEHCKNEPSCFKAFPNLVVEFQQLLNRFQASPVTVEISHPRLGTLTPFVIDKSKFTNTLRTQLYSMPARNLVPLIIHQAYLGNYLPLAGLISQTEGGVGVYLGLTLNIVCNEDIPRLTAQMMAADANNTFDGADGHFSWNTICPIWPKYTPSNDFYEPVTADIPTLILSGHLDPVTPPSNGQYPAKTLPNSHHIIVENSAHIVAMNDCGSVLINDFLNTLTPQELDASCFDELPDETFMTEINGGTKQ